MHIHTTTGKIHLKSCFVFLFQFMIAFCTAVKTTHQRKFNEALLQCMYLKKENNCRGQISLLWITTDYL